MNIINNLFLGLENDPNMHGILKNDLWSASPTHESFTVVSSVPPSTVSAMLSRQISVSQGSPTQHLWPMTRRATLVLFNGATQSAIVKNRCS